jgi:hypothetical protein
MPSDDKIRKNLTQAVDFGKPEIVTHPNVSHTVLASSFSDNFGKTLRVHIIFSISSELNALPENSLKDSSMICTTFPIIHYQVHPK